MSSNKRIFSGAYDFIKTDSGLVKAEASGKPNINIDREHTFVTHAFDPDLKDYQRRVFPLLDMIPSQETLGYPYVWNEQNDIPSNTEAVDPQKGVGEGIGRWKRCIKAQVGASDNIESEKRIFCVAKQFGLSQWKVFSIPPIWDSVYTFLVPLGHWRPTALKKL